MNSNDDPVPIVMAQVSYGMVFLGALALAAALPAYSISADVMFKIYLGIFIVFSICGLGFWANLKQKRGGRWLGLVFFLALFFACSYDFLKVFEKGLPDGKRHLWSFVFSSLFLYLSIAFLRNKRLKRYFR